MNPNSVYAGEDDVAVVGQELQLDHRESLLVLSLEVERLNWRPFVAVGEVALKRTTKVLQTYHLLLIARP